MEVAGLVHPREVDLVGEGEADGGLLAVAEDGESGGATGGDAAHGSAEDVVGEVEGPALAVDPQEDVAGDEGLVAREAGEGGQDEDAGAADAGQGIGGGDLVFDADRAGARLSGAGGGGLRAEEHVLSNPHQTLLLLECAGLGKHRTQAIERQCGI